MYLAEVGKNGWSQVCASLSEARRAIKARRNWLWDVSAFSEEWMDSVDYEAIWKDGEFVEGHWPSR